MIDFTNCIKIASTYGGSEKKKKIIYNDRHIQLNFQILFEKKEELLKDDTEFKNTCYNVFSVYKLNGKKVFYNEIFKNPPEDLKQAILRIVPRINMDKINKIIDDTETLLPLEKRFIKKSIKVRKEEILDRAYHNISKTVLVLLIFQP